LRLSDNRRSGKSGVVRLAAEGANFFLDDAPVSGFEILPGGFSAAALLLEHRRREVACLTCICDAYI
jgi:hypothetical protein